MKKIVLICFLLLLKFNGHCQVNSFKGEWILTQYQLYDGSPIYDPEVINNSVLINFLNDNSLLFCFDGVCNQSTYALRKNNFLNINGANYLIENQSGAQFDLIVNPNLDKSQKLRLKMVSKAVNDLTFTPNYYIAKNNEAVYESIPGLLEPYFLDGSKNAMAFILSKFNFPSYKNGGFVVRFIVSKDGTIHGVKVVASTDNNWNEKLIAAVYKTKDKWQAGSYNGEEVNIEIEYNFDLGYSKEAISGVDSVNQSKEYLNMAVLLEEQNIRDKEIESLLLKSIDYDPFNIQSYSLLSEYYFSTKQNDKACEQLKVLIGLNQNAAKDVYKLRCD